MNTRFNSEKYVYDRIEQLNRRVEQAKVDSSDSTNQSAARR
ncbi:MAG TPA: hypothetical protein VKE71_15325 [Candidatus Angelobacter sp.]|nr:hypothetical protein [Candidatus Angelobacter sp.]